MTEDHSGLKAFAALDSAEDTILWVDALGAIVYCNVAACKRLQYSRSELLQMTVGEINRDVTLSQYQNEIWPRIKSDQAVVLESYHRRKDGTCFPVEISTHYIEYEQEEFTCSFVKDITERKRTRERLEKVTQKYRAIVDMVGATDGVWDWHVGTKEAFFAPGFRKMLGYEANDKNGIPNELSSLDDRIHPDDLDEFWNSLRGLIESGGKYQHEFRMLRQDGEVIWVRCRAGVSESELAGATRVVASIHDISEQKKAEQELLAERERLRISNGNLEQFAYIASHDLQEPLRAIAGYVTLLQRKYADQLDEQAARYITKAAEGASRLQVLIQDLLKYVGIANTDEGRSVVALGDCVDYACRELELRIDEHDAIIEHDLPTFNCVKSLFYLLFQNLISNSLKYRSPDRPRIKIYSEIEDDRIKIVYEDNGIGIAAESMEQVFQVFRRLHHSEEYTGTGIGLSICRRIVECHDGQISLDPDYQGGCRFLMTLPVH